MLIDVYKCTLRTVHVFYWVDWIYALMYDRCAMLEQKVLLYSGSAYLWYICISKEFRLITSVYNLKIWSKHDKTHSQTNEEHDIIDIIFMCNTWDKVGK